MAGIDLGDAWADEVWEEGVWADGVWEGQEDVGGGPVSGQAGNVDAAKRQSRSFGVLGALGRGIRMIVFFIPGAF